MPSLVFILPSSFKTETVIATEVAVKIIPIKIQLKMFSVPKPILPKGNDTSKPRTIGTTTPAQAISVAASPVFLSSCRLVSSPVENIKRRTPIFENMASPSVPIENALPSPFTPFKRNSAVYSASLFSLTKPIIENPQSSPKIAGPITMPAII